MNFGFEHGQQACAPNAWQGARDRHAMGACA